MNITGDLLPPWFNYIDWIVSYCSMFFIILTIPLYLIEITVMIRLRKESYNGMFYRIFIAGAMVDVIAIFNNYFGAIFPAKGWFLDVYLSTGTTIGHIYIVVAWSTRYSQGLTVTLLALNRATAVCAPLRYAKIWHPKWVKWLFIAQIGIGFSVGAVLVPQSFSWDKHENGLYIQFDDDVFRFNFFRVAYALNTVYVIIIIITNLTMILMFKKKYRKRTAMSAQIDVRVLNEKQRQETNLAVVSTVTCLVELLYYTYIIYAFVINPHMNTKVFYLCYNLLNDMYGGMSAWLLIMLSTMLRDHVKHYLNHFIGNLKHLRCFVCNRLSNNTCDITMTHG